MRRSHFKHRSSLPDIYACKINEEEGDSAVFLQRRASLQESDLAGFTNGTQQTTSSSCSLESATSTVSLAFAGDLADEEATELHLAAYRCDVDAVSSALRKDSVQLRSKDSSGRTVLHYACWGGDAVTVQTILLPALVKSAHTRNCLSSHLEGLVTETDDYGRNALHYAALSGQKEVVALLLRNTTLSPFARDVEGVSPFLLSHQSKDDELVRLLGGEVSPYIFPIVSPKNEGTQKRRSRELLCRILLQQRKRARRFSEGKPEKSHLSRSLATESVRLRPQQDSSHRSSQRLPYKGTSSSRSERKREGETSVRDGASRVMDNYGRGPLFYAASGGGWAVVRMVVEKALREGQPLKAKASLSEGRPVKPKSCFSDRSLRSRPWRSVRLREGSETEAERSVTLEDILKTGLTPEGKTPLHVASEGGNMEAIDAFLSALEQSIMARVDDDLFRMQGSRLWERAVYVKPSAAKEASPGRCELEQEGRKNLQSALLGSKDISERWIDEEEQACLPPYCYLLSTDLSEESTQCQKRSPSELPFEVEGLQWYLSAIDDILLHRDTLGRTLFHISALRDHNFIVRRAILWRRSIRRRIHLCLRQYVKVILSFRLMKESEDGKTSIEGAATQRKRPEQYRRRRERASTPWELDQFQFSVGAYEEKRLQDEEKALFSAKDEKGRTILHCCAETQALSTLTLFVEELSCHSLLEDRDTDGFTPLLLACRSGSLAMVKYLCLIAGVDTDKVTPKGETACCVADAAGNSNVSAYLRTLGMKTPPSSKNSSPSRASSSTTNVTLRQIAKQYCRRALFDAIRRRDIPRISFLLENERVFGNERDDQGKSCLITAVERGHQEVVRFLLQRFRSDMDVDAAVEDCSEGNTALHIAVKSQQLPIIQLLVEIGRADPLKANRNGKTAMEMDFQNSAKGERNGAVNKLLAYLYTVIMPCITQRKGLWSPQKSSERRRDTQAAAESQRGGPVPIRKRVPLLHLPNCSERDPLSERSSCVSARNLTEGPCEGSEADLRRFRRWTPLKKCCEEDNEEKLRYLLDNGGKEWLRSNAIAARQLLREAFRWKGVRCLYSLVDSGVWSCLEVTEIEEILGKEVSKDDSAVRRLPLPIRYLKGRLEGGEQATKEALLEACRSDDEWRAKSIISAELERCSAASTPDHSHSPASSALSPPPAPRHSRKPGALAAQTIASLCSDFEEPSTSTTASTLSEKFSPGLLSSVSFAERPLEEVASTERVESERKAQEAWVGGLKEPRRDGFYREKSTTTSVVAALSSSSFGGKCEEKVSSEKERKNRRQSAARKSASWLLDEPFDNSGQPPAMFCAAKGSLAVLRCLVEDFGVDVLLKDRKGRNALHAACANSQLRVVRFIVNKLAPFAFVPFSSPSLPAFSSAAASSEGQSVYSLPTLSEVARSSSTLSVNAPAHDGQTALHIAAEKGEARVLRVLLQKGADATAVQDREKHLLPLHLACRKGDELSVQLLLARMPSDVLSRADESNAFLLSACRGGNVEIVKVLSRALRSLWERGGGGWRRKTAKGESCLDLACESGSLELVRYLVEEQQLLFFADEVHNNNCNNSCEASDGSGSCNGGMEEWTRKREAAARTCLRSSRRRAVSKAISMGQEMSTTVNNIDSKSERRLRSCSCVYVKNCQCQQSRSDGRIQCRTIKEAGQRDETPLFVKPLRLPSVPSSISRKSDSCGPVSPIRAEPSFPATGQRAFHAACASGAVPLVRYLVERWRADPRAQNSRRQTAAHVAAAYDRLGVLEYLDAALDVDLGERDGDGRTPLLLASARGQLKAVQYLAQRRPDAIEAADRDGRRPLHVACAMGHLQVAAYLAMVCGADVEAQTSSGSRPLRHALVGAHLPVGRLLLSCGARATAEDDDGWRLLHPISCQGNITAVAFVIRFLGEDPNRRDKYGCTPLHLSCYHGCLPLAKFFVEECDVDVDAKDDEGQTPLWKAVERGNAAAVRYLLDVEDGTVSSSASTSRREGGTIANSRTKNGRGLPLLLFAAAKGKVEIVEAIVKAVERDETIAEKQSNKEKVDKETDEKSQERMETEEKMKLKNGERKSLFSQTRRESALETADENGWTALHAAAFEGRLSVVRFLVKATPLSAAAITKDGKTALDLARERGRENVEVFLRQFV